jgi:hypothetical protein
MLYAGLDLSRKRLDFHLLDAEGATVEVGAAPPDVDGLCGLTQRLDRHGSRICAAIESMNGCGVRKLRPHSWINLVCRQNRGRHPTGCVRVRVPAERRHLRIATSRSCARSRRGAAWGRCGRRRCRKGRGRHPPYPAARDKRFGR